MFRMAQLLWPLKTSRYLPGTVVPYPLWTVCVTWLFPHCVTVGKQNARCQFKMFVSPHHRASSGTYVRAMRWRCVTISHYFESDGCDGEWTTLLFDFISFTLPLKSIIILLGSLSGRITYGKKLREETVTHSAVSVRDSIMQWKELSTKVKLKTLLSGFLQLFHWAGYCFDPPLSLEVEQKYPLKYTSVYMVNCILKMMTETAKIIAHLWHYSFFSQLCINISCLVFLF